MLDSETNFERICGIIKKWKWYELYADTIIDIVANVNSLGKINVFEETITGE